MRTYSKYSFLCSTKQFGEHIDAPSFGHPYWPEFNETSWELSGIKGYAHIKCVKRLDYFF